MKITIKELHGLLGQIIANPPKLTVGKAAVFPPPDFSPILAELKTWMEAWYPKPMLFQTPVIARQTFGVGPEIWAFPPLKSSKEVRPYGPPGFEPRKKPRKKRKPAIKKPAPKKVAKTKPKTKKRK